MQALDADRLWTDAQPLVLAGLPVGRRVAVARSADGKFVVFSPLRGTPKNIAALRALGEVSAFVVPSLFHDLFYPQYFSAFPRARFLGSPAVTAEHPDWPLAEITAATPELAGFAWQTIDGMPKVQEQVFLHRATRTLLIADALFNVARPAGLLARFVSWAARYRRRRAAPIAFRSPARAGSPSVRGIGDSGRRVGFRSHRARSRRSDRSRRTPCLARSVSRSARLSATAT